MWSSSKLESHLSHLEKPGSSVRMMIFDFSSVFNTIQPAILGDKLEFMEVDQPLTSWITSPAGHSM